jgi:hypothetical protein
MPAETAVLTPGKGLVAPEAVTADTQVESSIIRISFVFMGIPRPEGECWIYV